MAAKGPNFTATCKWAKYIVWWLVVQWIAALNLSLPLLQADFTWESFSSQNKAWVENMAKVFPKKTDPEKDPNKRVHENFDKAAARVVLLIKGKPVSCELIVEDDVFC